MARRKLPPLDNTVLGLGLDRVGLGRKLEPYYEAGMTTRDIAAAIGKSYGFVHRHLREAGVQLRPRGGPNGRARSRQAACQR